MSFITQDQSETLRWVAMHLETIKSRHEFAQEAIHALQKIRGQTKSQPGLVGRPCWFRLWLPTTKVWTEWLPAAWLAWSAQSDDGENGPVAIVETAEGEVCVPWAGNVRFADPAATT